MCCFHRLAMFSCCYATEEGTSFNCVTKSVDQEVASTKDHKQQNNMWITTLGYNNNDEYSAFGGSSLVRWLNSNKNENRTRTKICIHCCYCLTDLFLVTVTVTANWHNSCFCLLVSYFLLHRVTIQWIPFTPHPIAISLICTWSKFISLGAGIYLPVEKN